MSQQDLKTSQPTGDCAPTSTTRNTGTWYRRSVKEGIRARSGGSEAKRIQWMKPFSKVKNTSFDPGKVSIKWFEDGTLNVAYNCLDRHLASNAATRWRSSGRVMIRRTTGRSPTPRSCTPRCCRFANALKARGVQKGESVTIYLPMIPEAAVAMLACARIGAVHSVVFGGFCTKRLPAGWGIARSTIIITADEGLRGGRRIPLKANADAAAEKAGGVNSIIVVRRPAPRSTCNPARRLLSRHHQDRETIVHARR